MNKSQQVKFESLYRTHVSALKRQGKADKTIDVYARAVRRVAQFWDCCPHKLTQEQLGAHFDALVAYSWNSDTPTPAQTPQANGLASPCLGISI